MLSLQKTSFPCCCKCHSRACATALMNGPEDMELAGEGEAEILCRPRQVVGALSSRMRSRTIGAGVYAGGLSG